MRNINMFLLFLFLTFPFKQLSDYFCSGIKYSNVRMKKSIKSDRSVLLLVVNDFSVILRMNFRICIQSKIGRVIPFKSSIILNYARQ